MDDKSRENAKEIRIRGGISLDDVVNTLNSLKMISSESFFVTFNGIKLYSNEDLSLDDAYQHRKLRAGFYILLTSYDNLYVNDHMLPRGTLRDLPAESARANAVVVTKCPKTMQPIDRRIVSNSLRLASYQHLYYSSIGYDKLNISATPLLVAGIANPAPLLEHLQQQFPDTELLAFTDHRNFTRKDIQTILRKAENYAYVVTTEKDYMRMQQTPLIKALGDKLRVLPIQIDLGIDQPAFDRQILLYVSESNRTTLNNTTPF